ncbi:hypothetical protein ACROYT_G020175 [Oculina patagonica]
MAYSPFFLAVLLGLMLPNRNSAAQNRSRTSIYVSLSGRDSESCGTASQPCKTIAKAVHQVDWDGHIYLDGTGTEKNPFHCNLAMAPEQQPGIVVRKSVIMEGMKHTPYIVCTSGFLFAKSTSQAPMIVLSGIIFLRTPLMFQDCDLKMFNCSFQDASTALSVHITNNASRNLNILRSSFIKNNVLCVEIILHKNIRGQDQFLIINISETKFLNNGFSRQRFARGVVTIRSDATLPYSTHVQISCSNITSIRNYGHFINLDLPAAVTSEVYNDVILLNNTVCDLVKASSCKEAHNVVNSLYNSNTKKTRVKFSNLRCSHNRLLRCIKIHSEEAQVEIQNSSFIGQRLKNERGGAIFFNATVRGTVVIFSCRFRRNIAKGGGALFAHSKKGTLTLNFTKVNFTECAAETYGCAILVGDLKSAERENGSATYKLITNFRCIRIGFVGAFVITPKFSIKMINVVLAWFTYALLILEGRQTPKKPSDATPCYVSITNCSFLDNTVDMVAHVRDATHVELSIENTIFKSRQTSPIKVGLIVIVRPLKVLDYSSAFIKMHNVTFESKACSILGLLFQGNKTLKIQRSVFRNCLCSQRYSWDGNVYETSAGAITVITTPDKILTPGCVKKGTRKEIHPVWSYRTHTLFKDNIFEGNMGLVAGAAYISNGYTTFQNCTFLNNFAVENSGHVYSAYGTGQVDFKNCFFSSEKVNITINNTTFHKSVFFQSESGGPINFQNTSMVSFAATRNPYPVLDISNGGYVQIDDNSTIQCPIGSQLLLDNTTHYLYTEQNNSLCRINVTVVKYSCQLCPPGFYSIQKGTSRGLIVNSTVKCLECPFGASCIERNIAAKPNFWGFSTSSFPPSLRFMACPEHYCQKPTSESQGYNSCQGNRTGILCGKCTPGYSETLFSAKCRRNTECNNYWYWISTILLTTALALYLLIKPPILVLLRNQILWFHRREANIDEVDLDQNDEHLDSGYLKITFYFYQAAELLMVGSVEDLLEKIPFIYTVIAAFNFQVRTINKGLGCPFVGLTAVTKELLLSGTVFLTMADIAVIYYVHSFINMLGRKEKPPLIHYMAAIMEVLLLGYERLAETSLKLMHCVPIGSGKWLFIDANVPCMQWWQYILLAYVIVFVVPFMIVLYCGSSKLYRASITASEFLAACMFPLPFLVYWFYKEMQRRRREESTSMTVNRDVMNILHGPFRKPNSEDKGTLYWESVLIGRRFILLACQSFITNLMLRMVCMVAACFLITIHHVLKNPYRDPLANKAETLSLAALSMIAVISLTKATLISFGTAIDGPNRSYLETLDWLVVCALGFVPALMSILVTLAILSQLARLVVFLIKQIIGCWRQFSCNFWHKDQERRPLLVVAGQNNATEQNIDAES